MPPLGQQEGLSRASMMCEMRWRGVDNPRTEISGCMLSGNYGNRKSKVWTSETGVGQLGNVHFGRQDLDHALGEIIEDEIKEETRQGHRSV